MDHEIIPKLETKRHGTSCGCTYCDVSLLNDFFAHSPLVQPLQEDQKLLTGVRLLIVEEETLIALDIQRVAGGVNVEETVFSRNFKEFAQSSEATGQFDLAIVNPPRPGTADDRIFDRLVAAGTAIVICSATGLPPLGTQSANIETVAKPFSDDDLLAACKRALRSRPRP